MGAGENNQGKKTQKRRKTLRNCMASLLRSNIQDFVQEVPVGQMLRVPPAVAHPPPSKVLEGERGFNLPSVQHANQGWRTLNHTRDPYVM